MADEVGQDTFPYTVSGRELTLRAISAAQINMLQRFVENQERIGRDVTDPKELIAITKKISEAVWATVESQFIHPEELEFVQLEVIAGRATQESLMPILSNGIARTPTPPDDADPPKPKGRKQPAAKKAVAAKKTANPTRAKR